MAANALTLCRSETLEPLLISKEDMPTDKLVPADVESPLGKTEKCCHFSIRGYVADIRKSGMKIRGPFCDSLDMSSRLLPPITVAKFRWWECPSCFLQTRQTNKPEDNIRSISLDDGKRDISSEGSQLGVTYAVQPIELGTPKETSIEIVPQLSEADPKHSIDSDKSDPSLCEHLNNRDPGFSTSREVGDSDLKEDVFKTTVPSHNMETSEPYEVVLKTADTKRIVFKLKKKCSLTGLGGSETSDTRNAVLTAENETDVSKRMDTSFHSSISKDKLECSSSVNNSSDKEDTSEFDMMVHMSKLVSPRINSPNCEASKETLTDTSNIDSCKSHLALLSGNLNRKRTHKTRLLSDILNSEATKEDSVLAQKEDMEAEEAYVFPQNEVMAIKDDSILPGTVVIEPENNSDRGIQQGCVGTVEEHLGKAIESKKRSRLSEVEEDGTSLLCVLKRKIKKAKGVNVDAGSKNIDYQDSISEQKAEGIISKPIHSKDGIPSIERHITNVGNQKQHAKGRIETMQKGFVQMKQCNDAIQHSIPEGSALEAEYRDSDSYLFMDASSKGADHAGIKICNKLHKKVKGMKFDTNMKNANSAGVNAEQKAEVTTSKPRYPSHSNFSSVERDDTTNKSHKKKIKGHSINTMSPSLTQMNHHIDALQNSVPAGSFKGSKHIASHSQPITDSGTNVHLSVMVNNELHEKATLKPHEMAVSFEEKECQVNSKSLQKEAATGTKDIEDSPKKQTTEPLNQKGGTDSVDGIPVEILKLLQDNWQKRHMDGLENVGKKTYKMSEKKIGNVSDLTSDTGDQLVAGLCKNGKNQHTQWMDHHSQSEIVGLGKDFLPASPQYLPGEPSHYNTDVSSDVSRNSVRNAYHYSTGGSLSRLGTCSNQTKVSNKGHVHEFGQQTESLPFIREPGNGLAFPLADAGRFCLPDNQRVAEPMTNTCGKAQSFAERVLCCGCALNPPSVEFDFGRHQKTPSRTVHMDTLMSDNRPTENHLRKEDNRLKDMGATVQIQRWEHVAQSRASQEIHSINKLSNQGAANGYHANVMPEVGIGRNGVLTANGYNENVMAPVDNHRNEAISAMNLLRLMDSGACSSESLGTSKNKNIGERLNISHTYQHCESLWLGSKDRNDIDNRHRKPSEFLCEHQPRNSSNLYRPDARIGMPVAFSVNNRTTDINCVMSPFPYVDGHLGYFDYSPKKCQERNFLTCQTASPMEFSFSTVEDPQVPQTPNLAAHSPLTHKLGHVTLVGGKTEILQPSESRTDTCVLNRNPADFTIPDDNNEHMIAYGDISTGLCCLREDVPQISRDRRKQSKMFFPKGVVRL